jgi:hypothetical protein
MRADLPDLRRNARCAIALYASLQHPPIKGPEPLGRQSAHPLKCW